MTYFCLKVTKKGTTSKNLRMGAINPKAAPPPQKSATSKGILAPVACMVLLAGGVYLYLNSNQLLPNLEPKAAKQLAKRLREIDDSEQYALVAASDGHYPCLHGDRATFFLKTGEVWKYGVTSKGEFGRYSISFLVKNNVSYIVEFKGNFAECLKQEQIKLFTYPFLPENLARSPEDQLPRPPYNPVMR